MGADSDISLPAIAGGAPAKTTPYGKSKRYGDEELQELSEALNQGTLFYAHGNKVFSLEAAFAQKHGVKHAVASTSGTAAIHAALIALGISPGDEVITSPITDMGTVIPILLQGAIPVFADLCEDTYTLSPQSVKAHLSNRTRAIIVVHLAGNACDMDSLKTICREHNVRLVEDCAQALGCTYKGAPVGACGDVGCFSLNEFKHISCGDGGIAVTNDDELGKRLRLATDKGYDRSPCVAIRHSPFLANNYRMTELQGAVALAQLRKLDGIVQSRRRWCDELTRRLEYAPGLALPSATAGCDHSWWFYCMRVLVEEVGADATTIADALQKEGLPVSAHYIGQCVYEYPLFQNHAAYQRGEHPFNARTYKKGDCPAAERILDTALILAINEAYSDKDLDETSTAIHRVMNWFRSNHW